jgi:acyl dehydratase
MLTIMGVEQVTELVGRELGVSDWVEVTQEDVDRFADATGDHQWIHVDPERAALSPLGGTIAHGLYTLSLGPRFNDEVFRLDGFAMGLNYGYEKVRFPAPVPVGSRIRMRAALVSVDDVPGGIQIVVRQQFETEGATKPVCVADAVSRWLA